MTKSNPPLYPIIFSPIYKQTVWGGESWDVSCRPSEMSVIENGPCAGQTFASYIAANKELVLGTRLADCSAFPLLIKVIDANDALSIQVHPNDAYVLCSGDSGKSEMWYVLTPPTDGHLIVGLKPGVTRQSLVAALEIAIPGLTGAYQDKNPRHQADSLSQGSTGVKRNCSNGTIEDCFNRLAVKAGDIVNIPAGLVHALTPGAMVAEVQQNSDITYRIYDYNRPGLDGKPRPLQIKDALAVTDFEGETPQGVALGVCTKIGENHLTHYNCNKHFSVTKYDLVCIHAEESDYAAFSIFTCVSGHATLKTDCMTVDVTMGRTVFIPAGMGTYSITPGNGERAILLKSTVCVHSPI